MSEYRVTADELWHAGLRLSRGDTLTLSDRAAKYLDHAVELASAPLPVEAPVVVEPEPVEKSAPRSEKRPVKAAPVDGERG